MGGMLPRAAGVPSTPTTHTTPCPHFLCSTADNARTPAPTHLPAHPFVGQSVSGCLITPMASPMASSCPSSGHQCMLCFPPGSSAPLPPPSSLPPCPPGVVISRESWLKEAESAERASPPMVATCHAIVREVIGIGVEDEDRRRTWMADAEEMGRKGSVETARAIYEVGWGWGGGGVEGVRGSWEWGRGPGEGR